MYLTIWLKALTSSTVSDLNQSEEPVALNMLGISLLFHIIYN